MEREEKRGKEERKVEGKVGIYGGAVWPDHWRKSLVTERSSYGRTEVATVTIRVEWLTGQLVTDCSGRIYVNNHSTT